MSIPVTAISRRHFLSCLCSVAVAIAGGLFSGAAMANSWPTKPIRMIVPFSPGGPTDVLARTVADRLASVLGQPIAVENKPGATGSIGLGLLARAEPDGYTIGLGSSGSLSIYPAVNPKLSWDPIQDFAPISYLARTQLVLLVNPSLKIDSAADLITIAKAQPGKLTYATGGIGGAQHLATALLEDLAGISMRHIPYKGSAPAVMDLVGGQVDLMFEGTAPALPQVQAGNVRAIALSSDQPVEALPGVPPLSATLPGFDASVWFGLFAPAKTPSEIIDRYNQALGQVLREPQVVHQMAQVGMDAAYSTPQQMGDDLQKEIRKWGEIVTKANITSN